jgi:hypothetical protein
MKLIEKAQKTSDISKKQAYIDKSLSYKII